MAEQPVDKCDTCGVERPLIGLDQKMLCYICLKKEVKNGE